MKRNIITAVLVAGFLATPGFVLAATFTFTPPNSNCNAWNDLDNWDLGRVPGQGDTAIILAGDCCEVDATSEAIDVLELRFNLVDGGSRLKITRGGQLTIYKDCPNMDGQILFVDKTGETVEPVLYIADNLTMTGDGSQSGIVGDLSGSGVTGIIKGVSGKTLTIAKGSGFGLAIAGGMDIEVALVNNAAVLASSDTLTLKTNAKSGSGLWLATNDGVLKVDVAVSGSGTWKINANTDPKIKINAVCTNLSGDVWLTNRPFAATLEINANLQTSGHLYFETGTICIPPQVDSVTAKFHVSAP